METYNKKDMEAAGLTMEFVQDNQSCSVKGVLRGLHFKNNIPRENSYALLKAPYLMLPLT